MPFRKLNPARDVLTLAPGATSVTFQWGPEGPRPVFKGAKDWASYEYAAPSWRSFEKHPSDPWALPAMMLLHSVERQVGFPVGESPQGDLGWDPEWALLMAVSSSHKGISVPYFRDLVALSDPLVAHPSQDGPGRGAPLPVVLVRSSLPPFTRLKLLDCLPESALSCCHEGQGVVDIMLRKMEDQPPALKQATWVLLAWLAQRTGARALAFKQPPPQEPSNVDDRRDTEDMLNSKIIKKAFGHLKPAGTKLRLDHLVAPFLADHRAELAISHHPDPPVRPRLRRS